jgi:nucleoid DNA-binding protein
MTKQEFIDKVHEAARLDQAKTATTAIVESVFESLTEVLKADHSFRWHGFGTFETRQRPAREGRNPQTGEPMSIKASTTVAFRPATALKTRLQPKTTAKTKTSAKTKAKAKSKAK